MNDKQKQIKVNVGIQECRECKYKLRCEECVYNEKDISKLIDQARYQAVKKFAERVKNKLEEYRLENEYFIPNEPNGNLWQMNSSVFYIEVTQDGALIDELAKEFGVEIGEEV